MESLKYSTTKNTKYHQNTRTNRIEVLTRVSVEPRARKKGVALWAFWPLQQRRHTMTAPFPSFSLHSSYAIPLIESRYCTLECMVAGLPPPPPHTPPPVFPLPTTDRSRAGFEAPFRKERLSAMTSLPLPLGPKQAGGHRLSREGRYAGIEEGGGRERAPLTTFGRV